MWLPLTHLTTCPIETLQNQFKLTKTTKVNLSNNFDLIVINPSHSRIYPQIPPCMALSHFGCYSAARLRPPGSVLAISLDEPLRPRYQELLFVILASLQSTAFPVFYQLDCVWQTECIWSHSVLCVYHDVFIIHINKDT